MTAPNETPAVKARPVWLDPLLIGIKLLLICAIVAGVVSFVYSVTKAPAEANLAEEKRHAIVSIFGKEDIRYEAAGDGIYVVYDSDGSPLGYCVETASPGFGGDINLIVGFDRDRSIVGVSIVSLSETPGLGARVNDANYLSQYQGKSGELAFGSGVDAISGATISSRAVLTAVNQATALLESRPRPD